MPGHCPDRGRRRAAIDASRLRWTVPGRSTSLKIGMVRVTRIVASLAALALAVPAGAMADGGGSLLSGYSHPGGGEQQVLGPGLLPAKHGSGSIRAQTPVTQSTPAVTPVTPTPAPKPTPTHQTTAPVAPHTTPAASTSQQPTIAPGTPATSATPHVALPAAAVAYADESSDSGAGLPLSGSGIGLFLLVILGMVGLTLATRRAAEHPNPSG
jgi:hypothetical protein